MASIHPADWLTADEHDIHFQSDVDKTQVNEKSVESEEHLEENRGPILKSSRIDYAEPAKRSSFVELSEQPFSCSYARTFCKK